MLHLLRDPAVNVTLAEQPGGLLSQHICIYCNGTAYVYTVIYCNGTPPGPSGPLYLTNPAEGMYEGPSPTTSGTGAAVVPMRRCTSECASQF